MRIGIFPGSFDPLTNGHLDIIERAKRIVDLLVVAIAVNRAKNTLFSVEERMEIINNCYRDDTDVEIVNFNGLLVDYCRSRSINCIVRGVRNITDFEYEMSIASVNNKLAPGIETIFLMTRGENAFISSNIVREIAHYRGDVTGLVPQSVADKIHAKYSTFKN